MELLWNLWSELRAARCKTETTTQKLAAKETKFGKLELNAHFFAEKTGRGGSMLKVVKASIYGLKSAEKA